MPKCCEFCFCDIQTHEWFQVFKKVNKPSKYCAQREIGFYKKPIIFSIKSCYEFYIFDTVLRQIFEISYHYSRKECGMVHLLNENSQSPSHQRFTMCASKANKLGDQLLYVLNTEKEEYGCEHVLDKPQINLIGYILECNYSIDIFTESTGPLRKNIYRFGVEPSEGNEAEQETCGSCFAKDFVKAELLKTTELLDAFISALKTTAETITIFWNKS